MYNAHFNKYTCANKLTYGHFLYACSSMYASTVIYNIFYTVDTYHTQYALAPLSLIPQRGSCIIISAALSMINSAVSSSLIVKKNTFYDCSSSSQNGKD